MTLLNLSMSWNCREKPWWGDGLKLSLSRYFTNFFPFLFMRYLFCHILAMKTVAMENAQKSRHCEHSSSRQLRVFTKRLQFSRRQCKQTKEERKVSMYDKLANISNHQWGDRRLINKMAEKKNIVEQGCQLTVTTTQPERLGRLSVCFLRQIHFAPTEHNLKVGDCLSADRSFTSTWFIL